MIISGYERPVEYGRLLIFDPTMAQMVLLSLKQYNDALKDEYERGLKQMDDFYKTFGDFISPFEEDMKRYGQMIGGIRGALDEAYANNINLLGSPEGRMMISRLTNAIDPSEFNIMRTNAKLGFEYLKNIEEAKAKDQFSQEFEDYLLTHGGPGLFKDFSSKKGMWNRPGPGRYLTVDELLEPIVKNVDYTFDEAMTKAHNDGHDYYSITKDRLMKAVNDNMSDILATQSGGFHYWKAMEAARALGGDELMGKEIFKTMISNRLSDHEKTKKEVNQFALDDHRTANDMKAAWSSLAAQAYYGMIEKGADIDGDGKISRQERINYARSGGSGKKDPETHNIFREAEAYAPRYSIAHNAVGTTGVHVGYNPATQGKQLIDPMIPADNIIVQDANKNKKEAWQFRASDILNNVYEIDDNGKVIPSKIINNSGATSYTFVPSGALKAEHTPWGYNYYSRGTINGKVCWVKVKERAYNYGQ